MAVASGALALRPVAPLERALDLALLPGRVLASLAVPFGVLAAREGPEAAARRAARDEADLEAHRALEAGVRRAAWPVEGFLPQHVGAVQAEVIGHAADEFDVLRLAVAEPERVQVGQPVVAGDAYVGLVARIPGREPPPPAPRGLLERLARRLGLGARVAEHAANIVFVELVTAREARIGARIDVAEAGEPSRLVVGGLAPVPGAPFLAVHNPERRAARGVVRVHEPESLSHVASELADTFRIGELRTRPAPIEGADFTRDLLGVQPFLDYEAGLHQVLVLTSDGLQERKPARTRTVLRDGNWLGARFFVRFEPSPWREGRKLDRGRRHGVEAGAAVVSGARLVGRVVRAGLVTADVVLPGDVGFTFSALAELGGESADAATSAPLVLGRLVSLGRAPDGAVRFAWRPQRSLGGGDAGGDTDASGADASDADARDADANAADPSDAVPSPLVAVTLWTGSGEPGVPRGLLVGTALLPLGPGPHVVLVEQCEGARDPRGLAVRTAAASEVAR